MSKLYFISDHHFGHDNITKFEPVLRPFNNAKDMGEWLVAQHNSIITKRDTVVCGGDFAVGKYAKEALYQFAPQLNGTLHLLMGNHDDLDQEEYRKFFKKVRLNWNYKDTWITHMPVHTFELEHRRRLNLHGHLHSNTIDDDRYINMCVEHCDGIPREFDEWVKPNN